MKNRVKNLFIAGLMLFSMGLATVVQVMPAWAATKMVTYKSECDSLNGTVKTQVNGQYLCEYSSSNTQNITGSTRISGSSESDVIQKCEARGGKIGSGGIKNVARGAYEGECIPVSSSSSSTSTTDSSSSTGSNSSNNTNGTNTVTVKENGEYTFTGGVQAEDTLKTSIIDCSSGANGEGIFCILNIGLTVLTWGIGIAGTLGIVITGIQYLTARDSVEQMTKAKNRLINIIIGLVVYAVMWGLLNWLIPGGLF